MTRCLLVRVPADEADTAAGEVWWHEPLAVEERDDDGVTLVAAFTDDEALDRAAAAIGRRWAVEVLEVIDDGLDAWRVHAGAERAGERLVVVPAWLPYHAGPHELVVRIDPGRAFGSGSHATTRLVLAALERTIRPGERVLDVGCGSGVLAVAATLLGASSADAVDLDPEARRVTADNARRNGVADRVRVRAASLDELTPYEHAYDLVLANLLAPALLELSDALVAATGRVLVVSGLLAERWHHVAAALAPLPVVAVDELDGWVALTLGRPAG